MLFSGLKKQENLCLYLGLLPVVHLLGAAGADETTALLPLDAAADTDAVVKDELPDDVGPAAVLGQVVVELAGDLVELGQAGPGHGGEVVVLVVQADVVGEEVADAVVAVRLGDGHLVARVPLRRRHRRVDVVLRDEVARQRVQRAGEERRQQEVQQRLSAQRLQDDQVEDHLHGHVGRRDPGEGHAVDGHGPDGVEEDLEGAEEGLAEDGVEKDGLEGGRQVRVESVDAKRLVVRQVVGAERGTVGNANGQVGEDGEQTVGGRRAEGKVVRDLVDGQEEVLVGSRAYDVGQGPEGQREEGRVAQQVGAVDLHRHDKCHDVLGQGLGAAQLGDLGVGLDDGQAPRAVRLLGVGPEEVPVVLLLLGALAGLGIVGDLRVELDDLGLLLVLAGRGGRDGRGRLGGCHNRSLAAV